MYTIKDNIKNLPTVNCYMYHLCFDQRYKERNQSLVSSVTRDENIAEYYRDAPVHMLAHYTVIGRLSKLGMDVMA